MTHARPPYPDRAAAGRELAGQLTEYAGRRDVLVLALARGGVPVAVPVAQALHAPLDVLVVRKLGAPGRPELAMGAVAAIEGAVEVVRNEQIIRSLRVSTQDVDRVSRSEVAELQRCEADYRQGRPPLSVRDRVVLLVDDGLATGTTARAAIAAVRTQNPARVVLAVPIGASENCLALRGTADQVVCSWTPQPFRAVGQGYLDFAPTDDEQVRQGLRQTAGIDRRRTVR